jgi:hypothetical protein
MVRSGFGNYKEVMDLKEKYGIDYLMELQYILSILNQEDELDARHSHRS